ncbi:pantoate--beta-alanine ligase [Beggiatoa alba]|nr:pantoate--beta-alanine ligase [Beggiatoa alba]
MKIINSIAEMKGWSHACHKKGQRLSFVPTMGNLHAGHLALVDTAIVLADKIVVSIYVNPTQFAENEDFDNYPRTQRQDLEKLQQKKVDVVFMPTSEEMYPKSERLESIDIPEFAKELEGQTRPDHFQGVAIVVKKLFDAVLPDHAIFGEKDFQQLLLVKNMVSALGIKLVIHAAAIIRDIDGLAKSSRNQYLTDAQRKRAPHLYQSLISARRMILEGDLSEADIESQFIESINKKGFEVDYFVIRDATTLGSPGKQNRVILVAARLGNTRLLDNLRVDLS